MSQRADNQQPPLPQHGRLKVLRNLVVFQLKLFLDGVKDVMLSPVSLIAGLIGILLSRQPGDPFYRTLRFGKRIERWIDLFGAARVTDPEPDTGATDATRDFDTLIDRLQSSLMNAEERAKLSEQSKKQLEQIAKKLRGSQPPNE